MKQDITNRTDLTLLMEAFYSKALTDETIGYFFTEVVQLSMEKHLPLIVDFWDSVLFDAGIYKGNAINVHQQLHEKSPFRAEHFSRWIALFYETVDGLFEGDNAIKIKQRASSIATVMTIKTVYGKESIKKIE